MEEKVPERIEIIPPQISDETMRKMSEFFMKYAIPVLIEKLEKEGEAK